MSEELKQAAQQALEALDEIHAGKCHPQLALAVAHNLRRALTQRPAAQADDWRTPTTYAQRFAEAVALLCRETPPADMVAAWIDRASGDHSLQDWACERAPAWAQGIGLLDAAHVMADQPTEGVNHEPTQPAAQAGEQAAKCQTCNGHGLVGGHMQDGSGYGEGCPDCNPEPAAQATPEPSCSQGCTTECLAQMHGCTSECPALPHRPPFKQATPDHLPDAGKMVQAMPEPTPEHDMAGMLERGAKAWAGVDPQEIRAGGQATPEPVGEVVAWWYLEDGDVKFGHPSGHRPDDARPLIFADTRPAPGVPEDVQREIAAALALFPINIPGQSFVVNGVNEGRLLEADGDTYFFSQKKVIALLEKLYTHLAAAQAKGGQ